MTDHLVPLTYCPECGLKLDCASDHGNPRMPQPGDFSVCIICMAVLRYTDDLQLRAATLAERNEAGPELETFIKSVQLAQISSVGLSWGRKR